MKLKQILIAVLIMALIANAIYQSIEIRQLKLTVINIDNNIGDLDDEMSSVHSDVNTIKDDVSNIEEKATDISDNVDYIKRWMKTD